MSKQIKPLIEMEGYQWSGISIFYIILQTLPREMYNEYPKNMQIAADM